MKNAPELEILKRSVAEWNHWRRDHPDDEPQFSHADLSGVNLRGANLTHANLRYAKFRSANLSKALLRSALLSGADLTGADLRGADLRAASLRRAKLIGADLRQAVLRHCSCVETNFERADLREAEIYGIAAWRLEGTPKHQSNLIVRADRKQPAITVDNLEVAQFIFLLMNNPRSATWCRRLGRRRC